MRLNPLFIISFILIAGCKQTETPANCTTHEVYLQTYSDHQQFKVSFCMDDSLKEVEALHWGVRDAKAFENQHEEYTISFQDDEKNIVDGKLPINIIEFGFQALKCGTLNQLEFIEIDTSTCGIYAEFQRDSFYFNVFEGYNKEALFPFSVIRSATSKRTNFKNLIMSFRVDKI